jgi:hypothetical protein
MSRGHSDHDHAADEKLKDEPAPKETAESPAPAPPELAGRDRTPPAPRNVGDGQQTADAPDPSINPPPEPVEVKDETLAHVHDLLSKIVAAMQVLAAQVPAGHTLAPHFSQIKIGLAALFDRAHAK